MLARKYVAHTFKSRGRITINPQCTRFASKGPPKKTLRSKIDSARSTQYQPPPERPSSPRRLKQESSNVPPPKAHFLGLPSKLAVGVFGGIAVLAGYYTFTVLKGISIESNRSLELGDVDPEASTAKTYDHIAPYFDQQVSSNEWWLGISNLRKQIIGQARGDVLEVGVGTGRNHTYYNLKKCRSITFLDASENMIAIASAKWNQRNLLPEWRETTPEGARRVNFNIKDATDVVTPPILAGEKNSPGFTAIVSTFTLCSIPLPADALAHLCTLLSKDQSQEPRLLLLEHGKSSYDWVNNLLNNSAPAHATQYGCWWNRDIGAIAHEAAEKVGMEVTSTRRKHFGTTWIIEMRPKAGLTNVGLATTELLADTSQHETTGEGPSAQPPKKWWEWWR